MKLYSFISVFFFSVQLIHAQQRDTIDGRIITLAEIVVDSKMNVSGFMNRVMSDTSFYKAFRNLRVLEFSALNDISMLDKKGRSIASLTSRTRQRIDHGCRHTEKISEKVTGPFYEKDGSTHYYTAALYSGLMFAFDTICGENNIIGSKVLNVRDKSGINKHKEQLKMLFFNPGSPVPGIPFMGNKTALFDRDMSDEYDFQIDMAEKNKRLHYVFTSTAKRKKNGDKNANVVIDSMVTWFDAESMEVSSRSYSLSYDAGLYSFDVDMEVELGRFGKFLLPTLIRYNGEWKLITRKKEKGVFTATLFDFSEGKTR